jgi:glutamate synthase (NADPH/NADH) large chain
LIVDGDANDYVGKGLSGAHIIVAPQGRTPIDHHDSSIIGNTCLYGATQGVLMASGRAGERFAVRNSGARSVVEGLGTNGCEYMTGGTVVILGSVGDNFGAGMTGGMAYVYDEDGSFEKACNPDSIVWQRFEAKHYEDECLDLIRMHARETGSGFSNKIVHDWAFAREKFWQVVPKEMLGRLKHPLSDAA